MFLDAILSLSPVLIYFRLSPDNVQMAKINRSFRDEPPRYEVELGVREHFFFPGEILPPGLPR